MKNPLLIAIDGPSASGKGSLAAKIADRYDIAYLNTGALYRAVAWRLINDDEISLENFEINLDKLTKNIGDDNLDAEELFSEKTGEIASKIAKNAFLRLKLIEFQKDFIQNGISSKNGAVLDGRDISSIIMPEANFKFFVTASVEIRAQRRFKQLSEKGENVTFDEILKQLKKRDENDQNRKNSPLIIDGDAFIIDNGALNAKETFLKVVEIIEKA